MSGVFYHAPVFLHQKSNFMFTSHRIFKCCSQLFSPHFRTKKTSTHSTIWVGGREFLLAGNYQWFRSIWVIRYIRHEGLYARAVEIGVEVRNTKPYICGLMASAFEHLFCFAVWWEVIGGKYMIADMSMWNLNVFKHTISGADSIAIFS